MITGQQAWIAGSGNWLFICGLTMIVVSLAAGLVAWLTAHRGKRLEPWDALQVLDECFASSNPIQIGVAGQLSNSL